MWLYMSFCLCILVLLPCFVLKYSCKIKCITYSLVELALWYMIEHWFLICIISYWKYPIIWSHTPDPTSTDLWPHPLLPIVLAKPLTRATMLKACTYLANRDIHIQVEWAIWLSWCLLAALKYLIQYFSLTVHPLYFISESPSTMEPNFQAWESLMVEGWNMSYRNNQEQIPCSIKLIFYIFQNDFWCILCEEK